MKKEEAVFLNRGELLRCVYTSRSNKIIEVDHIVPVYVGTTLKRVAIKYWDGVQLKTADSRAYARVEVL